MSDLGGMRRKKAEPPGKQSGGETGATGEFFVGYDIHLSQSKRTR
jgi:hypothetical protein